MIRSVDFRMLGKLVIFIAGLAVTSAAAVDSSESFHYFGHEFDKTPLGSAIDKASSRFLKEAYSVADDKNVVSSPLGVMMLLSMYAGGLAPEGKLQKEIIDTLSGTNLERLSSDFSSIAKKYTTMDPSFLNLANIIYVDNEFTLNKTYEDFTKTQFKSGVEKVNFKEPANAAKVINQWAEEQTHKHIKDAVSEDALTPDVVMGMFNVIFFQGHWGVPFEAKQTSEKDFFIAKDKSVKKPTMHLLRSFFYWESETLGARLLELPYKESGFRMIVFLPNEVDGLQSVLEKVAEHGMLDEIFKIAPARAEICLNMPKFEIKSEMDLKNVLPKTGIPSLFSETATGVVNGVPIKISKAFQKAFVKVDEEGATAAAFTGFIAVPTSSFSEPPPPIHFNVDRPFLFSILHEDIVLFTGTYTH